MKRAPYWLLLLLLTLSLGIWLVPAMAAPPAPTPAGIQGPVLGEPVVPAVFNGDLRDLPQLEDLPPAEPQELPLLHPPGEASKPAGSAGVSRPDPVAQTEAGVGQMPAPLIDFEGLQRSDAGYYSPPDTNGDVGPNHYIQTVNVGIGIYDKATGTELVAISYNDFFDGTGTPCDYSNRGDPIVLYDPLADRWIITDFSWLGNNPPSYECIAVSQTGDPVAGGWYFYALLASFTSLNDYPKLAVWPDAYYMTANMFILPSFEWDGVRIWALDREAMLAGDPLDWFYFDLAPDSGFGSLLPANLRGDPPPEGAPNYVASFSAPDQINIWEFHIDWDLPGNSTFTGPTQIPVAPFSIASDVPQYDTPQLLDSLSFRPMMQLQYRNVGTHEALWMNHTIDTQDIAAVRWYEIRDPGGTPTLHQQGTYQPDTLWRWMGSLAVDGDGNMAVGYSVSSSSMYPSIRYAGRRAGEMLGVLPQAETSLIEGTGSQTGTNRWGDYSAMSIDPVDDCTFWYTNEYLEAMGPEWHTRIGAFRFPSCGQPQGTLQVHAYNAVTLEGVPDVMVVAEGITETLTFETGAAGDYAIDLLPGTYTLTAGPKLPGYPTPAVVGDVVVTAGETTNVDIPLDPVPYLEEGAPAIDDDVVYGNNNGYPEPGEQGLLLWNSLANTGALTATQITAQLVSSTPGVTVTVDSAGYPDIGPGQTLDNLTPFEFSIDPSLPCGSVLDFTKVVTTAEGTFSASFSLDAKVPLPVTSVFTDDIESGPGDWTTGGVNNLWAIVDYTSHSPTHAWADSPAGDYLNNTNSWLQSATFDLTGKTGLTFSGWYTYALESGYDYVYLEYSLDGGSTWQPDALATFNGYQMDWLQAEADASALDDQPSAALRFRLHSDGGVVDDGIHIDDLDLYYEPFVCYPPVIATGVPVPLSPPDGTLTTTHAITLTWATGLGGKPAGYNVNLDGEVFTTTDTFLGTDLDLGPHAWQVRAFNPLGASDYSPAWTVEITAPPGIPIPLAPPDGTITATQSITFTWMAGEGPAPSGYNLELDGDVYTTTATSWATVLEPGDHAWRVRAFNAWGVSDYSPAWDLSVRYQVYLPLALRNE